MDLNAILKADGFQKIAFLDDAATNLVGSFAKLTDFVRELSAEEQRGVAAQWTEVELVLFDILTKPEFDITDKE